MKRSVWKIGLGSAAITLGLTCGYQLLPRISTPASAAANEVTFPPIEQLQQYTTVERGATKELMLTSRAALDALKAGRSVPTGTQVVLVDYQSGKLHRYLVSQKVGSGADDWQYQWFWPDRTVKADENTNRCYSCHQSRQHTQFMFTFADAVGDERDGS